MLAKVAFGFARQRLFNTKPRLFGACVKSNFVCVHVVSVVVLDFRARYSPVI